MCGSCEERGSDRPFVHATRRRRRAGLGSRRTHAHPTQLHDTDPPGTPLTFLSGISSVFDDSTVPPRFIRSCHNRVRLVPPSLAFSAPLTMRPFASPAPSRPTRQTSTLPCAITDAIKEEHASKPSPAVDHEPARANQSPKSEGLRKGSSRRGRSPSGKLLLHRPISDDAASTWLDDGSRCQTEMRDHPSGSRFGAILPRTPETPVPRRACDLVVRRILPMQDSRRWTCRPPPSLK